MPAGYCPHCHEITNVEYTEYKILKWVFTEIVCLKCHKTIRADWEELKND